MLWFIPALLALAAVALWRLSFHTDDYVIACVRFCMALLLLFAAAVSGGVLLVTGCL